MSRQARTAPEAPTLESSLAWIHQHYPSVVLQFGNRETFGASVKLCVFSKAGNQLARAVGSSLETVALDAVRQLQNLNEKES